MDGSWTLSPSAIASFIVFIGTLIFVHELGHFLAARYFDIKVVKFSLGFGPPLIAFKRGEIQYQIAAIPLGGFVKMVGDNPMDEIAPEDRSRAFTTAPIYKRVVIALAGPAFNLLFPVICFFAHNLLGPTVTSPIVGSVEVGRPAERAGLRSGDRILSINGERAWKFERIRDLVSSHAGEKLDIELLREGKKLDLTVTPAAEQGEDLFGSRETTGRIGITPAQMGTRVGVDGGAGSAFVTGDQILEIGDRPVQRLDELERAVREMAGRTVRVVVARPEPLTAGDLLFADASQPVTLTVAIPPGATGLDSLGLAPSDMFLRAIRPGGAADRAGLRPGDRIVRVDGRPVTLFWSFLPQVVNGGKQAVDLVVRRNGVEVPVTLVSDEVKRKHEVTGKERKYYDPGLGVGSPATEDTLHWSSIIASPTEVAHLSIAEAFSQSVHETLDVIGVTAMFLLKLFSGGVSPDNVGGTFMLYQVASTAAQLGIFAYLKMLAMVSVNLGLFNLLPIPVLDGGHLMFCAVEAIKRRPVSLRVREAASIIGIVLLLALMVLALKNDILRAGIFRES